MKELHDTQREILRLLKENIEDPLTIRELQERLSISSPSVVFHHISQLEKKGLLKRNPSNPSDYQILTDSPEKKIAYLNLFGLAQCGPKGTFLDDDPIDRIPISTSLLSFPSKEGFLVKAKGDSMMPRINSGDYVVARRTSDKPHNQIVVCVNDGEALVKKLYVQDDIKRGNNTLLVSLNSKYPPIIAKSDFRVVGIVKGVISKNI
jgi:repressor LexA